MIRYGKGVKCSKAFAFVCRSEWDRNRESTTYPGLNRSNVISAY
jgi:hypothetical protein